MTTQGQEFAYWKDELGPELRGGRSRAGGGVALARDGGSTGNGGRWVPMRGFWSWVQQGRTGRENKIPNLWLSRWSDGKAIYQPG